MFPCFHDSSKQYPFKAIISLQIHVSKATCIETRWYPRGIQKLVSTYELPEIWEGGYSGVCKTESAMSWPNFNFGGRGGYSRLTQTHSAKIYPNLHFQGGEYSRPTQTQIAKICPKFSLGAGTPDKLKLKVPRSAQMFIGGGGGIQTNSNSRPTFLKNLGSTQGIFEHKFIPLELATTSQIVSHILRMWRLINHSMPFNLLLQPRSILAHNAGHVQ